MARARSHKRLVAIVLCLSVAMSPWGCMTKPPSLDLHEQLQVQRIALLYEPSEVGIALEVHAKSRSEGALKGAGQGIAGMLQGLGGSSCSGEYCGAALLFYLALSVVVGGTVGAIQGSLESAPAKVGTDMEAFVEKQLAEIFLQLDLLGKVLKRSAEMGGPILEVVHREGTGKNLTDSELRRLAAQGYQKVLVIQLTGCDFRSIGVQGEDPLLGLELNASTRITDTERLIVDYRREFRFSGAVKRYSEWRALSSNALRAELDATFERLAEDIFDALFLSYALPIDSGSWSLPGTHDYGCCWLCPVEPPLKIDFFPVLTQDWPIVSSQQPRLEWQKFPNEDRQARLVEHFGDPAEHVRYDLRIWEMVGDQKGPLVYERTALPTAAHQIEKSLKPQSAYLWSFRACFNLDKRPACTPWAFSLLPAAPGACESTSVGPGNYYRFRTP